MTSLADPIANELRLSLRRLAKAVVVISVERAGERYAMVATAVNEVSFDPPSMLACVNRSSSIHAPMSAGAPFCLNILDAGHEAISRRCVGARQGEARFQGGDWRGSEFGAPYLEDAQANIFCRLDQSLPVGTHDVFVGRVLGALTRGGVDPLVYADGRYGRFAPLDEGSDQPS